MGKPTICIGESIGFRDCTGRFVSDLMGTQIVGFLMYRLILYKMRGVLTT